LITWPVLPYLHRALGDVGATDDGRFDLSEFNPEPAEFDLPIGSSHKDELPV